jgi:hypothetical protein
VAELLGAAATIIRADLFALPAAVRTWHPAGGEWCAQEVLGHLIEAEKRGFAGRIRIILANDNAKFEGWDQDAVARARNDCGRDWAGLWDEFPALRADSVPRGRPVLPICCAGAAPQGGFLTVGDLLHEWVHHDRNHIRQMLANVQAFAWPHMGNAQRFSLP